MVSAALAARVVEVIADLGATAGARYRYGSGCIVRGRTVLTAAHVVDGAVSVVVRNPDKREYTAKVDPQFVGDAGGPGPDLALLEIDDPAFESVLPPVALATVDRDSGEPVERCHAVGYPWFAENQARITVRDTVDAIGIIPVLSKLARGLLSLQVTVAPRELPPQQTTLAASEWSGMSGAPVVADGCLLGVVTEHAPREGASAITVVPLTALEANPVHLPRGSGVADPDAWWSRLGAGGIGDLRRLPPRQPPRQPPAYRATLQEFGRTLHHRMPQLLGRDRELAEIAAFATGGEGYRWLVGGAFTGKTALLYEAVTVGLPDEVDVVFYFLSRRASDASSDRFLAAVVPQLAYLCGVADPEPNRDQYNALWRQAVGQVSLNGRHLLLVVDGLDEDLRPSHSPSVASLLPTLTGSHAHVLVTSRPRPDLPEDLPDGHPMKVTPIRLSPFRGARELADLARRELYDLTVGGDTDLAVEVLGLLTAAAGALSLADLVALRSGAEGTATAADIRHVRKLVEDRAARSLEPVGAVGKERYQFAHASLLEYAQTVPDLCDPEYRQRIHHWADLWQVAGWPASVGGERGTPQYLLDTYPAILAEDPQQLAQLVGDIGWIEAAIASAGVDQVLADLRQATAAAHPASTVIAAFTAVVTGQISDLRPPQPIDQVGYILRQLWMQAAGLVSDDLAEEIRSRLQFKAGSRLVPRWTTRSPRADPALSGELSRYDSTVLAVAALANGEVVTGGLDGRVLVWDPARPGISPVELGRHDVWANSAAALPDGRVVTGGFDKQVLLWDPARPLIGPVELGGHDGEVRTVAALPDGRVASGGFDKRVLLWDPTRPLTSPVELGRHNDWVWAIAALPDGRVISGGDDRRVLLWDPAHPLTSPVELGRHNGRVWGIATLPDGRVVTGGADRRLLIWDPTRPETGPSEMGHHRQAVRAVTALPDGRVVTGGLDRQVLIWDITATVGTPVVQLSCPVTALAAAQTDPTRTNLAIAHEGVGCSLWSLTG